MSDDLTWRAIDSAPMDGTKILGTDGQGWAVIEWSKTWGYWQYSMDGKLEWADVNDTFEPTHWMPLPAPPKEG